NKMTDMMKNESLEVEHRVAAIRAIGFLIAANVVNSSKAVDDLIRMVNDERRDPIVYESIGALSVIGTPQAVDALIGAYRDYFNKEKPLADRDVPVREVVAKAMISTLNVQAARANPDLETVHKMALLLNDMLQKDPAMQVKLAAI